MTLIANRERAVDALARHRYEKYDAHFTMPSGLSWEQYKAEDPDGARGVYTADAEEDLAALLTSGAVIDAATLADEWEGRARETGPLNYRAALDDCARELRALAAALTERGERDG